MKPVVTSLVALALAIAPFAAWAAPETSASHDKPVAAKVAKHAPKKGSKVAKHKEAKLDSHEKPGVVQVKHTTAKKTGKLVQVHHAQGVDVSGPGHKEPRDHDVIVPASMSTKSSHMKPVVAKEPIKKSELPNLPSPGTGKPGKGSAEKGKKASSKKADEKKSDGEPARDEDFAELVARIRGISNPSAAPSKGAADEAPAKGKQAKKPCAKDPVEVIRGPEVERFALATCDGKIAPLAVEHLSILTRPGGAARPTTPVEELAKAAAKKSEIAPGIRRLEDRLVANLSSVVEHFAKDGAVPKVSIVSGYRPTSVGSMHQTGRAIDFRLEGVKNEDVVSFCKTLDDTGCGFYPNSSFVHMDVRDSGAGHVTWIDASGPGENPRYVAAWPPPAPKAIARSKRDVLETTSARRKEDVDAPEVIDDHPAAPSGDADKTDKTDKDSESDD